jgi:predicted ATP-dependent serine protease
MNLQCQHCGELIIARSFGKCPGCHRDLPEELQLSPKELELEELEDTWRSIEERRTQLGTIEIFPTVIFPKGKELE